MNELCANGIWILGCGSVISSHICKCVECRRYRRFNEWQICQKKTEESPPFTYHVDCFGPFNGGEKGNSNYMDCCLLACAQEWYIETLDDLITDTFVNTSVYSYQRTCTPILMRSGNKFHGR